MTKFIKYWFPVIVYSGIIFYVSSIGKVETPFKEVFFDKILHFGEYFVYGFLMIRALVNTVDGFSFKFLLFFAFSLTVLYGISDEFHQSFVEGRSSSIYDVFADVVGGAIGCFVYPIITKLLKIKK